jgi:hypothetical protein
MQWISVKDKLPEYDVRVLVWGEHKGNNPQMGGAYPVITERVDLKETHQRNLRRYVCENDFKMMAYVTHWMPLPESPNKK